jgi:hypothetical protein
MKGIRYAACVCSYSALICAGCGKPAPEPDPVRPVRAIKVGDLKAVSGREFPGRSQAVDRMSRRGYRLAEVCPADAEAARPYPEFLPITTSRYVKKLRRMITVHHFSGCGTAEISFSADKALDGRSLRQHGEGFPLHYWAQP